MDSEFAFILGIFACIAVLIVTVATASTIGNNYWNAQYADIAKSCIASGKTWQVARGSRDVMVCEDAR